MEAQVKWIDLGRFHAALKVIPHSPLRETELTCLEVLDERAFSELIVGAGPHEPIRSGTPPSARERSQVWWAQMEQLGFSRTPEWLDTAQPDGPRAFRLYSPRSAFSLSEL